MTTAVSGESPQTSGTRVFWRYWTATAASSLGTAVSAVALPLVAVIALDSTALQVSVLVSAEYLGWLVLGLPAGVITQRIPLRPLQITMDLTRAAALLSLPLAWGLGRLTFLHLLISVLVIGFASVLFDVANAAFLPSIIDADLLTSRNSLISGTLAVTGTGGPALGGLLVQVLGPVLTLVADAVSYVTSAVTLWQMPRTPTPVTAPTGRAFALIAEGWRFVRRHRAIFPSMLWATAINFTSGALAALIPLYLVREVHAEAFLVGLLIATAGVGSLIGSTVAPRLASWLGSARAMLLVSSIGAVLALLMPLTASAALAPLFALGNAGFACGVVVGSIVTRTHRQTASPPEMLSRVMATVRFVSWGASPVGAVGAGILATGVGLRGALWGACSCAFAGPLILLLSPLRGHRDLADLN